MPRRKTHSEFIEELKRIDPSIYVVGEYKNSRTPIVVRCTKCGKEWTPTPHDLLSGKGCRECKTKESSIKRKKTKADFENELSSINPNIEIIGDYYGRHQKIDLRCSVCGYVWKSTPGDLLRGFGCKKCGIQRRSDKKRISNYDFISRVSILNSDIEIISDYKGANQTISVKCKKCGHVWETKAENLLQGRGCPKCALKKSADKRRKTTEEYKGELFSIHPNLTVLGEYTGDNQKIKVQCNVCNYTWEPKAGSLLRSWGCKRCSRSGTSYIEQCILIAFSNAIGEEKVLSRDCSAIGMELDVYVPDFKFAIEPGSWVFHKNSLPRDILKRQRCSDSGIELITVYYDFPNGFSCPFNDNCILFINNKPNSINNLIYDLLQRMGVECTFTETEWDSIKKQAKDNSMGKNTEKFKEEMNVIHPEITVLGIYQGSKIPILLKCNNCGKEWSARPNNILAGQRCPDCSKQQSADRNTKTHEQFCSELSTKQPNIKVLGIYEKSKKPILVECKVCGKQWEPIPNSLLNGEGCPVCGLVKKAEHRKKTKEEFEAELFRANPDFQLISEYNGTTKQVKLRCTRCGYEWTRIARKVLENPIHKNMKELHSK